jgi:hypothetical protein
LKQPPENLFAPAYPVSGARVGPKSGERLWDRPDPPKDFAEYVRFRLEHEPGNQGAMLYLELLSRSDTQEFEAEWKNAFANAPPYWWHPGDPLTESQRQWLLAHQDFIGLLRRMIAAGGPPMPTREEIQRIVPAKIMCFPPPDLWLFHVYGESLAAESQRRRADGDLADAAEILLDAYPLGAMPMRQFMIGCRVGGAIRNIANQALSAWLQADFPPEPLARRMEEFLDAHTIPTRELTTPLELDYLCKRSDLVAFLDQPLTGIVMNGYGIQHYPAEGKNYFDLLVDDPAPIVYATYKAFRMRTNAETLIRQYDASWSRLLPLARQPFAVFKAADNPEMLVMTTWPLTPNHAQVVIPDFLYMTPVYASEAGTNLNRAALHLILDEPRPVPPDPAVPDWLNSPWRDPFTEKALRMVEEEDATTIYSIGPDLEDQGGAFAYDPTNGEISPGDLAIRLPHRRP